ncbi:MAG TPA: hypothetical protein VGB17_11165 [Pyrinomonadaceae bacterium]
MSSAWSTERSVYVSIARVALAAWLALALLSGIAPLASLSANSICQMECCAGKPTHAAGSCAGGSCHARFALKEEAAQPEAEAHCGTGEQAMAAHGIAHSTAHGATHKATHGAGHEMHKAPAPVTKQDDSVILKDGPAARGEDSLLHHSTPLPGMAANAFKRPCREDCGAGAFGSSSQKNSRHTALLSQAERPRPPTRARSLIQADGAASLLEALCGSSRPRAPPLSFS